VSRSMHLGSAILLMVLAVLVGLVCGVVADRLALEYHFARRARGHMESHLMDRLQKDLALSPAQRAQVDSVFREQGVRIDRLRNEVDHLFVARQDSFEMELAKVLTPAQLQKLHHMIPRRPPGFLRGLAPRGPFRGPGVGRGPGDDHDRDRPPGGPMGPGPEPGR
jgi:hypothetical protein